MALNHPAQGEGYVAAYQISATPYVTSSTVSLGSIREIVFPQVTRFITLKNTSTSTNTIAVGFTRLGFIALIVRNITKRDKIATEAICTSIETKPTKIPAITEVRRAPELQ